MKLDILLPSSLSEIPLSRYQEFINMKDNSNDEESLKSRILNLDLFQSLTI